MHKERRYIYHTSESPRLNCLEDHVKLAPFGHNLYSVNFSKPYVYALNGYNLL